MPNAPKCPNCKQADPLTKLCPTCRERLQKTRAAYARKYYADNIEYLREYSRKKGAEWRVRNARKSINMTKELFEEKK